MQGSRIQSAVLAIVALLGVAVAVQNFLLQERLDRLEASVRRPVKEPVVPAPPDAQLLARLEELEKSVREARAARPAATVAPLTDPAAGSPAFQEGVRKVYSRVRDEERANDIVLTRKMTTHMINDELHLDEAQAGALKPIFEEQAARIEAYYRQVLENPEMVAGRTGLLLDGRPGDGSLRAVIWEKDRELRRAAYERMKPVLRPSQGVAAKQWVEWKFDPRERDILERWERMTRNQDSAPLRAQFEEAMRQLHEESDHNEGKSDAFVKMQTREREVRAGLLERLTSHYSENELDALKRYFGVLDRPTWRPGEVR